MKRISLCILLSASGLYAQHSHSNCTGHDTDHGHQTPAVELEIRPAGGGLIERTVDFPAEIRLNRNRFAAVSPRYAGTLRELRAEVGDRVKQGEVLALLENRETLAVYPVLSPLDGTVISKNGAAGETAGDDSVLFEVADLSGVWAVIHVFPQYQPAVYKGAPVKMTARNGRTVSGFIDYISPILSHETHTFEARCELSDAGSGFSPGAFLRAQIVVESVQAEVCVEQEAVQTIHGEQVVFVQEAGGVEPQDVQTGLSDGTFIEIRSGLAPGELYVARGAFELKAALLVSGLDPHAGHGH